MGRRKKNKNEDTAKTIIRAAITVFHTSGFHGARMHHIAKKAKVNQALIHYYYGSKENLYGEVLKSVFSRFSAEVKKHFSEGATIEESLEGFINGYINIFRDQPEIAAIIFQEILSGAKHLLKAADNVFNSKEAHPREVIISFLTKFSEKGLLKNIDPKQTILSIIGMCVFYFIGKPLVNHIWGIPSNEDVFIEQRKKAIKELILYGILNQNKTGTGK